MPLPPIPGDDFLAFQADQWRRQKEAELEQLRAAGWAVHNQNLVGHLGNAFSDLGGAVQGLQRPTVPALPTLASDLGAGIGQTFSALGTGIQTQEVQPAQALGALGSAALAQGGANLQAARDYPQTNVAPVLEDWSQSAQGLIDRIGQLFPAAPAPGPAPPAAAAGGLPAPAAFGAPAASATPPELQSFLQQSTLAPGVDPSQPAGTSLPAAPSPLGGLGDALGGLAGSVRQGAQALGQGVGQALSGNLSTVIPDYTPPDLRAVADYLGGAPALTPGGLGAGLGAALASGTPNRTTALAGGVADVVRTQSLEPGQAALAATQAERTRDYDDFLARLTAGTPGALTPERRAQLAADASRYDETMQNFAGGLAVRGPAAVAKTAAGAVGAAEDAAAAAAGGTLPGAPARALMPSEREALRRAVAAGRPPPPEVRQAVLAEHVRNGMTTQEAAAAADRQLAAEHLTTAIEEHTSLPSQVISLLTRNLLGVPTTVGNALGNVVLTARRPVTETLGGRPLDAVDDVRAMAGAIVDAAGAFREAWKGRPVLQNAVDWVGPTLGGTDNFFRTLNGAGARAVAARRGYAAPQAEKFVTAAVDQALLSSRGTLLGETLTKARQAMHSSDPLDRAMGYASWAATPFTRVPDAILRQAAEVAISPVRDPIAFVKAVGAKDGPAAQDAVGRLLLNGPIAYFATVKALDNGLLTGMGPKDPKRLAQLRAARDEQGNPVWQPRSVKVGGNWVPYNNVFGPYAPLVEAIATAYERGQEQDAKPDTDLQKKVDTWIRSGVAGFADATYVESLLRFAKGVEEDPVKQGLRSTGDVLSRAIPGPVGQLARATDPYQRETDQSRPWEAVQSRVPGLRERLPAQISPTTGEAVKAPAPTLASILLNAAGTTPADPVANEVNRLAGAGAAVTVPTVDRNLDYAGVRQTPEARRAYQEALGKEVNREVQALLDTPGYQQAPDAQKAQALKDAFGRARTWAGVAVGDRIKRDPKHQADYEFLAVPQYEGVSSRQTPEQIRTENLKIAQARSLLADYRAKYPATPARGEAEMAKADPKTFNLAKRGKLPADFLRVRKEAVAKRVGTSPDDDPGQAVLSAGAAR